MSQKGDLIHGKLNVYLSTRTANSDIVLSAKLSESLVTVRCELWKSILTVFIRLFHESLNLQVPPDNFAAFFVELIAVFPLHEGVP